MNSVLWAALGIGGSTLIGTGCGFLFSRVTQRWNDIVTAFAAGVMLAATAFGLFEPAMEMGSDPWGWALIVSGAVCGALFLRAAAHFSGRLGGEGLFQRRPELLFVLAIALHKFPEGMAGGIGLSGMDAGAALTVVVGISLQNLPEGVIMIPPLIDAGVSPWRSALIALATGLLNAAGVFAGALWGRLAQSILAFPLAFAGGAMLDVIITNMIPQTVCAREFRQAGWIVMAGFLIMTCINAAF